MSWDRLDPEKQKDLTERGWTKKAWDRDDPTLMTFYNEAELDWKYLPEGRKKYWTDRDYDEDKWSNEESELHDSPFALKGDPAVVPRVLKVQLRDLDRYDLSYYESLEDVKVEVRNGQDQVSDERPAALMNLKEYICSIHAGKTDYKFNIEDLDMEKDTFAEVGAVITKAIHQAMTNSGLASQSGGPFTEEWQNKDPDFFNWSIWLGGKGTRTPMHFDTELFNFLYVVQGKKRVVVIPNDHRTKGMFPIKEFFSGSAWTGVDVLDPNFELPEGSIDVEIGPGEGIFIPFRNWHAVENVENTVAYGFRVLE